jgi:hypothetical protein
MRRAPTLLALVLTVPALGCGSGHPPAYPVQGRLEYTDGTPVPGRASVAFHAEVDGKEYRAGGRVLPDGTFRLTTFGKEDGAVAGQHRVTISPIPGGDEDKGGPTVAAQYDAIEKSGLTATVEPRGENAVVLRVSKPDTRRK